MEFQPENLEQKAIYKLLSGIVIPRPIGWISSMCTDGIPNLAPFSFFNAAGDDPPHVMFSISKSSGNNKDTLTNILSTKEFVVNMVDESVVEQMHITGQGVPSHIDEFKLAGLTPFPSVKVKPPRVKESPMAMECELVHHYTLENSKFGGSTIVIGKILVFHINDNLVSDDYKIDSELYQPIAKVTGLHYAKPGENFVVKS